MLIPHQGKMRHLDETSASEKHEFPALIMTLRSKYVPSLHGLFTWSSRGCEREDDLTRYVLFQRPIMTDPLLDTQPP